MFRFAAVTAVFLALWMTTGRLAIGVAWQSRHGLTAEELQTRTDELKAEGFQPVLINGYVEGGKARFAAIWENRATPWEARSELTREKMQTLFDELTKKGFRLTHQSGYVVNAEVRYSEIFEKKEGPEWESKMGLTRKELQERIDELKKKGWGPTMLNAYVLDGEPRYCAIWEKTDVAWDARAELTRLEFQNLFDKLTHEGFRLVDQSGFVTKGEIRYCAVFQKRSGPIWESRMGLNNEEYQRHFDAMAKKGLRPVNVSAFETNEGPRFCAIWEKE